MAESYQNVSMDEESSESAVSGRASTERKVSQKRERHKSGAPSYADLLSQAILSTPERRSTLAEIYDWLAQNVPCLHAQRFVHSSKGWKNAVRHTLSVNNRFRKIPRMGRPSFWTMAAIPEGIQQHESASSGADAWKNVSSSESSVSNDPNEFRYELTAFRSRSNSDPTYKLQKAGSNTNNQQSGLPSCSYAQPEVDQQAHSQIISVVQPDGEYKNVCVYGPVAYREVALTDATTQTMSDATDKPSCSAQSGHAMEFEPQQFSDWPQCRYELYSDWSE